MSLIYNLYIKLNQNENLTAHELDSVMSDSSIKDYQLTSLIACIILNDRISQQELSFIQTTKQKLPEIEKYINSISLIKTGKRPTELNSYESTLLFNVYWKRELGNKAIGELIGNVSFQKLNNNFLSLLLVFIKFFGLTGSDLVVLTEAMAKSGKIYDYRNNKLLDYRKVIRRYPTGALSEKIALIMPSLLIAFSRNLPICSPFLVAKSLSYTGGTWDKLKSIDGFKFPTQGEETIEVLKECKVSMSVTENDFNPADRFLYQFRSITNTVESFDLIVSSIASKQIGIPADSLLLDIRFGPGAFLSSEIASDEIGNSISTILKNSNIKTKNINTFTGQPTGSSIGNYWEVLEALALMSNSNQIFGYSFDERAIKEQYHLVIRLTVELLLLEFPNLNSQLLTTNATEFFRNGTVLSCFLKLLITHNVDGKIVENIRRNRNWLSVPIIEHNIIASSSGVLNDIKQKQIGSFVNFGLGGGLNQLTGKTNYYSGMILSKRLNDDVKKGEVLAKVFCTNTVSRELLEDKKYFNIQAA